ncbi:hypothetical protein H5410_024821 [Solanum commersonii]|uniref:F-box associated beta-propeller type 1 domain-containing protein n=1 Tax=Solanum commersonii TaxID=4109 RepID=A0A9J5ZN55_SOLCO|nr:hypothetical protein H5410_024821 [Solanum commersonii]
MGVSKRINITLKDWYIIYRAKVEVLFLWNPSIRELYKLPHSGIDVRKYRFAYGFGYVECQKDYQIVEIVASKSSYLIAHINVYSLRSNSWKTIQEFPSTLSLPKYVQFVKGKLHWITGGGDGGGGDSYVTWFNPGDATFGNVAILPNPNSDAIDWGLVSSSGNLCITCDYKHRMYVWIMKEYGVAESWTMVGSMPSISMIRPIYISRNDEILLQDISDLVWWYVSRDDGTSLVWWYVSRQDSISHKGYELSHYADNLLGWVLSSAS